MGERWSEQVERLKLMGDERRGDKWDLSPNDRAAIRAAIEARVRTHELLADVQAVLRLLDSKIPHHGECLAAHEACVSILDRLGALVRET